MNGGPPVRLRYARLRHKAVEDVGYRAARGLDRTLFQALIAGRVLQKTGRRGVSRLEGGLLAWQQKGLPVEEKALAERR